MTDADLAAGGGGIVAELVQSRNASAVEALAIFRAQISGFRRRLAKQRGYRLSSAALCLALPTFFVVEYIGIDRDWFSDMPPLFFAAVTALFFAGAFRLWRRYHYRIYGEIYRDCFKAGRRFRIEESGIVAMESGGVASVPWKAITDIVVDKDSIAIYVSPLQTVSLPKAAFENQDVEGFCAELQRRWQASKTDLDSAAAASA